MRNELALARVIAFNNICRRILKLSFWDRPFMHAYFKNIDSLEILVRKRIIRGPITFY